MANARFNDAGHLVRVFTANGMDDRRFRLYGPFDLIIANILARPLMKNGEVHRRARGTDRYARPVRPQDRGRPAHPVCLWLPGICAGQTPGKGRLADADPRPGPQDRVRKRMARTRDGDH
ncbi:hypothetical protein QW131_14865 [Roseibium salinum]|nr:hypothetical protein [Roseibium salinum]